MAEPQTNENKREEIFRSFRVDTTLVLVGLFLALGVQNIIQFIETASPHVSPYFYLGVGVGSLSLVLVCLRFAARIAGIEEIGRERHYQRQKASRPPRDTSVSGAEGPTND